MSVSHLYAISMTVRTGSPGTEVAGCELPCGSSGREASALNPAGVFEHWKRVSESMELDLQAVVSCLTQVPGTDPGSSARTASA